MDPLVADLRRIVGSDHVLTDDLQSYERDWTGRFSGTAPAVVLPASVGEIAAILAYCNERSIAIVPQGGNTGLVGGGVPCDGEIVLSTKRIRGVTVEADHVTADAGATLSLVRSVLADHGREVPIDLGARDSATIGGMASTNAGGNMAFRFGRMSHLVIGATVATAAGEVLAGDEAVWLAVGSEGTGCVIADVTLRTRLLPETRMTSVLRLGSPAEVMEGAVALKDDLPSLVAAEYVPSATAGLIPRILGRRVPIDTGSGHLLMIEVEDSDPGDMLDVLERVGVRDAVVAQDEAQRAALWHMRDDLTDALHVAGPPLKLDVRVAVERTVAYLTWLTDHGSPHVFGHILEGNLHVNFLGLHEDEHASTTRSVIRAALDHGGRVVGEHGAGRTKRALLELETETAAIERFHSLKDRFDPNRILNPAITVPIYEIA